MPYASNQFTACDVTQACPPGTQPIIAQVVDKCAVTLRLCPQLPRFVTQWVFLHRLMRGLPRGADLLCRIPKQRTACDNSKALVKPDSVRLAPWGSLL